MRFIKWSAAALVLFLAAGMLMACEEDKSVEEARDDLCDDLETFNEQLQSLDAIDSSSTVGELREARDDVAEAWDGVVASAEDVDDAEIEELEAAYESLDDTIEGIEDDAVISDVVADVQEEIDAVEAAWQQAFTVTPCEGTPATTPTSEATATSTAEAEPTAETPEAAATETPAATAPAASPTAGTSPTAEPVTTEPAATATP